MFRMSSRPRRDMGPGTHGRVPRRSRARPRSRRIQDGHAPSSGRVPGRGGHQVPGVGVIDDPASCTRTSGRLRGGVGVVQVATRGAAAAARRGAGRVAGPDQVLEFAAGPVAVLGPGVLARSADDRGEFPDVQEVQQAAQGHPSRGPRRPRRPRAGSGPAAVSGRGPVGVQDGHAPPGGRVPGRGGDQVPGVGVIQDPEPGHLTRRPDRRPARSAAR